jgi:transcription antitermination factor NusG
MVPQRSVRVRCMAQNGQMSEPLHKGDQAIILTGPFEGKVGTIAVIDGDVATLTVDVFARDAPVRVPLADLTVPPESDS